MTLPKFVQSFILYHVNCETLELSIINEPFLTFFLMISFFNGITMNTKGFKDLASQTVSYLSPCVHENWKDHLSSQVCVVRFWKFNSELWNV